MANSRYWHILLHFENGKSEIDDKRFFLAEDGFKNPSSELAATIDSLLNETVFDDNSTACRFPARKDWLQKQLNLPILPEVECSEFNIVMKKLQPNSATLVFPSAHINSPASMFGHTFLRINSKFNSKLLSYAVNYAADADPSKENGVVFAIKGLFGGYFGKYSLLPYYEKLKEYRDGEQRDVWEYDLDLSEEETIRMLKHIWELNNTHSYYYFFTQNCSYNMLWFIEAAREEIHLREYFNYQVIPLETVHASKLENIITNKSYRPSKRTVLLRYEELIDKNNIDLVQKIIDNTAYVSTLVNSTNISLQQKQYIIEAAVELIEYQYKRNDMDNKTYLKKFHKLSSARAALGKGDVLKFKTPINPLNGHRSIRLLSGFGFREGESIGFLGIRPAYHDINDITDGFMRGTQIEFLNLELSYSENQELELEKATVFSVVSLAQRSEFFKTISWRGKLGYDRNNLNTDKVNFLLSVGAGLSWGNEFGYIYLLADPFIYPAQKDSFGIGGSIGLMLDGYDSVSTNIELTDRLYNDKENQRLLSASQNFKLKQNSELRIVYQYTQRLIDDIEMNEDTFKLQLNLYF